MVEALPGLVNADARLVSRGRFLNVVFLLEVGDTPYLIEIAAGRVAGVRRGPFVLPRWTFALRAPSDAWEKFWQADPPPGFNDLFALLRRRLLRIEGDMHPLMANLFYFKGVLAALRAAKPS